MRGDSTYTLIVGRDGVSITGTDSVVTVRFAECAVMLVWPDGGRMLIGHDGVTVRVEPTMFEIDAATLASLDAGVPADVVVRQSARNPDAIPQPAAQPLRASNNEPGLRGAGQGLKSSADPNGLRRDVVKPPVAGEAPTAGAPVRFRGLKIVGLVISAIFLTVCGIGSAISTQQQLSGASSVDPETPGWAIAFVLALFWFATAFFGLSTLLLSRRLRRR
jgi:hypothetical protein